MHLASSRRFLLERISQGGLVIDGVEEEGEAHGENETDWASGQSLLESVHGRGVSVNLVSTEGSRRRQDVVRQ
jgi:hypothetical protein